MDISKFERAREGVTDCLKNLVKTVGFPSDPEKLNINIYTDVAYEGITHLVMAKPGDP